MRKLPVETPTSWPSLCSVAWPQAPMYSPEGDCVAELGPGRSGSITDFPAGGQ